MERLSGLDAGLLYMETPSLHMHTLKYAVLDVSDLDGGYSFERFRDELDARLHLLPMFRRRLQEVPMSLHHPVWVDDVDFDLSSHIRRIGVPPPGGPAEVDEMISEIASWQLDRRRPLWEIWVLEGMADGKVGFLSKIHHALADGLAAAAMLGNVMTGEPGVEAAPRPDWAPTSSPSRRRLVRDALVEHVPNVRRVPGVAADAARRVLDVRDFRRTAETVPPRARGDAPKTVFNTSITARRAFVSATLPLDDLKAVKAAFGVSLNDVFLALIGGSLRHYLADRDALPDRPLVAGVPVGTDVGSGRDRGNKVSNLFTSLCTDIDDPVERLRRVHAVTAGAKRVQSLFGTETMANLVEYAPPKPYTWAMRQYSKRRLADRHDPPQNLVASNVPGPREPLYIAGARLDGIWSVGPILEGIGLNITAWSYLGDLNIGVLTCKDVVADPRPIADAMTGELRALRALS